MTVTVTPNPQDTWPPSVAVAVAGLTATDLVTVNRLVAGVRYPLRGAADVVVAGTTLAVTDAELPFGVPVGYTVKRNGSEVAISSSTTYDLEGGNVALSDAVTRLAAEVVITTWPARRRERKASTFPLTASGGAGYTVVVSGAAGRFTGQVELATTTDAAADSLTLLLEQCTSGVVQLRVPDATAYTRTDCYLAVLAWEEQRWSQDGTDAKRRWILDVAEVTGWATTLAAQGWSYDDWRAAYAVSYDTVAADYATYLDAAVADIGAL